MVASGIILVSQGCLVAVIANVVFSQQFPVDANSPWDKRTETTSSSILDTTIENEHFFNKKHELIYGKPDNRPQLNSFDVHGPSYPDISYKADEENYTANVTEFNDTVSTTTVPTSGFFSTFFGALFGTSIDSNSSDTTATPQNVSSTRLSFNLSSPQYGINVNSSQPDYFPIETSSSKYNSDVASNFDITSRNSSFGLIDHRFKRSNFESNFSTPRSDSFRFASKNDATASSPGGYFSRYNTSANKNFPSSRHSSNSDTTDSTDYYSSPSFGSGSTRYDSHLSARRNGFIRHSSFESRESEDSSESPFGTNKDSDSHLDSSFSSSLITNNRRPVAGYHNGSYVIVRPSDYDSDSGSSIGSFGSVIPYDNDVVSRGSDTSSKSNSLYPNDFQNLPSSIFRATSNGYVRGAHGSTNSAYPEDNPYIGTTGFVAGTGNFYPYPSASSSSSFSGSGVFGPPIIRVRGSPSSVRGSASSVPGSPSSVRGSPSSVRGSPFQSTEYLPESTTTAQEEPTTLRSF